MPRPRSTLNPNMPMIGVRVPQRLYKELQTDAEVWGIDIPATIRMLLAAGVHRCYEWPAGEAQFLELNGRHFVMVHIGIGQADLAAEIIESCAHYQEAP